jgi:hypothetical protein
MQVNFLFYQEFALLSSTLRCHGMVKEDAAGSWRGDGLTMLRLTPEDSAGAGTGRLHHSQFLR